MAYALWNPLPWGLFLLGIAVCAGSVSLFHRKYPDFPWMTPENGIARDVMCPLTVNTRHIGNIPRHRVNTETPLSEVLQLLAEGALMVGVEDADAELIGTISMRELSNSTKFTIGVVDVHSLGARRR